MAWNRSTDTEPETTAPRPTPSGGGGSRPSTLGPSISIKGTLKGREDLRVEGSVEGTIRFDKQSVLVSESGRIKADIFASKICVEGEVEGNLFGESEIVIRPSGKLEGNITAPSVTLENGAKFRGSIDMEPAAEKKQEGAKRPNDTKAADKAGEKSQPNTPRTTAAATAGSSR